MSSTSDPKINPDTKNSEENDNIRGKDEEKKDSDEDGIISRIANGVQEFAEALAAGERNVVTDSLNHPASGQADLIATNKKALKIGEKLEIENEMRKN